MNSVCHPVGPPGPHAPRTPRRRPFLRSRFADLMESPACGPLWLTVCALAFVFGVCAESQGSHPSVGRLEKRVGRSPTSVPTHFLYGMEQQTSHVQPLFLLHVGCSGDGTRECPWPITLVKGGPTLRLSPFLYKISAPLSLSLYIF